MDPIYLDHHATTPADPRVVEAMLPYFTEIFGNPSSITHAHGKKAANAVEDGRITIARFLEVQPNELTFTAGATESNNIALNVEGHVITSAIEHKSVINAARGATILTPDQEGFIYAEQVREALTRDTKLVSIEAANGEIGTLQPIAEIGALCRERGILFHTDATQALGKVALDLEHVDLASFSAHKLYGPKGIGALFVRRGVRAKAVIVGGGQEKGLRSGTINVPGVVGFAKAVQLRNEEMADEAVRLTSLRNELWDRLTREIEGVSVHGPRALRLPGNLNVSFERIEADSLILAMRRFSLSSGSACSSGERGPSRLLTAIGAPPEAVANGAIRIGLGKSNTAEQLAMFVDDCKRAVARLREISAA
ncbi:MAG TPA: cysteine desulfurase family protein [Thermoanaerobaculia bacterium]|jgi:cysteine desulfurase|nr:cysteine desulfurase family protein [Thermoanaerobaculia bacterium]